MLRNVVYFTDVNECSSSYSFKLLTLPSHHHRRQKHNWERTDHGSWSIQSSMHKGKIKTQQAEHCSKQKVQTTIGLKVEDKAKAQLKIMHGAKLKEQ